MAHQPSSYVLNQAYSSQRHENLIDGWNQYSNGYGHAINNYPSNQVPLFQIPPPQMSQNSYQMDSINTKGPMTQLLAQSHPLSNIRAYNPTPAIMKMSARPGALNPIQGRKERSKQAQPARDPKRQKVSAPVNDRGHTRCSSTAESMVSECCSSCPDTPPCDESDCCDEVECKSQPVAVVACREQDCEKPACSNPCLTAGIKAVSFSNVSTEDTTSRWIYNQFSSHVPHGMGSTECIQLNMNGGFNAPYNSTSASPAPTTPSMGHDLNTPYSPHNSLPTPQYGTLSTQMPHNDQTAGVLSSADVYNHVDWPDYVDDTNYAYLTGCLWNGCQEQSFSDDQQWLSHLHHEHIDPQLTFGCPIPSETCSMTISSNPMDHLQTDHGYNFNIGDLPYSCPSPECPPEQTFSSPSMFHDHFDHAHGVPAQGSLHCGWEACGTTFVEPQDLFVHISKFHKLPIALPKEVSKLSASAETASILASLPTLGARPNASIASTTSPEAEADGDFDAKPTVHLCKWKEGNDSCGKICDTEEALQKHIKHDHLEQLDKQSGYKCLWDGCGRDTKRGEKSGFTQRGKLERHMATHTGFKCCACAECGKTFSAEQSLRQHMLLHKGEKPWKCRHCGKGFPQQSACTIHERTHTKEKPLQCPTCGKCFSESSNLSKHRKIHGEKGLNNCDFPGCGKSFHRLDQLKRHRATHDRQAERVRRKSSLDMGVGLMGGSKALLSGDWGSGNDEGEQFVVEE